MATIIYYNPLDEICKSKIGAIKEQDVIEFNIFALKEEKKAIGDVKSKICEQDCIQPTKKAYFRLKKDGENVEIFPMHITSFGWNIAISIQEIGLYFYSFEIEGEGVVSCNDLETGELMPSENMFLLTVSSKDYQTPDWFKGGILYQIFPDRFYRDGSMPDIIGRIQRNNWGETPYFRPNEKGKVLNNDFFGGSFKGIEKKLPYLASLGITTIYLNPIFEAASNHRYDTSDYMKVDAMLGTEDDFSSLISSAEKYNIKLILDGVFNHTGDDSVYFNKYGKYPSVGAYQSKDSPYYSWYNFQEHPDKYGSWWGIDILPETNEESESYQNFIFGNDGVLKHWLRFGIGGYRLDVADELPDFFLKKLRQSVKEENPDAIIIGEVWEDASNKIAYSKRREYLQGYELDSVMNYPLKDAIIYYLQSGDAKAVLRTIRVLINHYPKETVDCLMNLLGTHDTARILTVIGGIYCNNKEEMALPSAYLSEENKQIAIKKLKIGAVLQYTLPGVPCLYYGDENAAEGHIDPFCRRCFDWDNLNTDLIDFYKKLGMIRNRFKPILKNGNFENIYTNDGLMFFKRFNEHGSIYIFVNNSTKSYAFDFPGIYHELLKDVQYQNQIHIDGNSYGILYEIKN